MRVQEPMIKQAPVTVEFINGSFWVNIQGIRCLRFEPHTGLIYWQPGDDNDYCLGKLKVPEQPDYVLENRLGKFLKSLDESYVGA